LFLGSKETYEKFILIRSKIVENQETAIKAWSIRTTTFCIILITHRYILEYTRFSSIHIKLKFGDRIKGNSKRFIE
jgi:hypothetical protein